MRLISEEEYSALPLIGRGAVGALYRAVSQLGIGDISSEGLMELAEAFCGEGQITHNHVFTVTPFDMYSALVAADALGHSRRALAD